MSQEDPNPEEKDGMETGLVVATEADLRTLPKGKNPWPTKAFMKAALLPFVGEMNITGQDNIADLDPNRPTVVTFGPHASNADVPSVYNALKNRLSPLVIPHASTHNTDIGHRVMYAATGGKRVFIAVPYDLDDRLKETGKAKWTFGHGKWNPDQLDAITQRMLVDGSIPIIAASPFAPYEPMTRVRAGTTLLALSTGAQILPVGVSVQGNKKREIRRDDRNNIIQKGGVITGGNGASLEGGSEIFKALGRKLAVEVNIGKPLSVDRMDLADLAKPDRRDKAGLERHRTLVQSVGIVRDQIGEAIASLLPEGERGYYAD